MTIDECFILFFILKVALQIKETLLEKRQWFQPHVEARASSAVKRQASRVPMQERILAPLPESH